MGRRREEESAPNLFGNTVTVNGHQHKHVLVIQLSQEGNGCDTDQVSRLLVKQGNVNYK